MVMEKRYRYEQPPVLISASLCNWYATLAGKLLLTEIKACLDDLLTEVFGYHAVQVGCIALNADLLGGSRIKHQVRIDLDPQVADVVADSAALPLDADCIDLVVLMHTLDFAAQPYNVLREVERVLIPEGRLIVVGFNPWSTYGLWHLALGWRNRPPWCGQFHSNSKLKDWLSLLGFVTERCNYCGFRPPVQHTGLLQRLALMEQIGRRALPIFGGIRMLTARKRVATLTPLKPRWQRRNLVSGKLAEPSTRAHTNVQTR
jgi:SAM-dependent methyltransferase